MKRYIIFWSRVVERTNAKIKFIEANDNGSIVQREIKQKQQRILNYAILRIREACKIYSHV